MDSDPVQVGQWLEWCSAHSQRERGRPLSTKTLATKASRLRTACHFLGDYSSVMCGPTLDGLHHALVNRDEWETLLAKLSANLTPRTVGNLVSTLRSYGMWAVKAGVIPACAIQARDAPVAPPVGPHALYSREDTEKLIAAAVGVRGAGRRLRALLLVLSETGCRIGEALALRWEDVRVDLEPTCPAHGVSRDRSAAHVRCTCATPPHAVLNVTKAGKPQYLALSKRVVAEVFSPEARASVLASRGRFTRDPDVYVFPWAYCSLRTMLDKLCERCGVTNLGFHAWRHTRATELLGKGVPIQAVAALLRHSSVAVTDRYYNATDALSYARYLE